MAAEQATEQKEIGHKNQKVGKVVSARMAKTIVVEVTRRVPHPVYKRVISKRKKFYAHDEQSAAKIGDTVRIIECRPISKLKRWRLGDIIRKAVQVAVEPAHVDLDTPVAPLVGKPVTKTPAGRKS